MQLNELNHADMCGHVRWDLLFLVLFVVLFRVLPLARSAEGLAKQVVDALAGKQSDADGYTKILVPRAQLQRKLQSILLTDMLFSTVFFG